MAVVVARSRMVAVVVPAAAAALRLRLLRGGLLCLPQLGLRLPPPLFFRIFFLAFSSAFLAASLS